MPCSIAEQNTISLVYLLLPLYISAFPSGTKRQLPSLTHYPLPLQALSQSRSTRRSCAAQQHSSLPFALSCIMAIEILGPPAYLQAGSQQILIIPTTILHRYTTRHYEGTPKAKTKSTRMSQLSSKKLPIASSIDRVESKRSRLSKSTMRIPHHTHQLHGRGRRSRRRRS